MKVVAVALVTKPDDVNVLTHRIPCSLNIQNKLLNGFRKAREVNC